MIRMWLDTEFNEHGGDLISLALVGEDGSEFYEVVPCPNPKPWVADNVMPVLHKAPISVGDLTAKLGAFLRKHGPVCVIADWPCDIELFCNALITGPGTAIETPPLTFVLDRTLPDTAQASKIPHNALEDARALRAYAMSSVPSGEGE